MPALRVEYGFDIVPLLPLADFEGEPEQMDVAAGCHLANEGHSAGRERHRFEGHPEVRRQLLEFAASAILLGRQPTEARMDMLRVDRVLQALQFADQRAGTAEVPLEQPRLKPAVEVFDAALPLRPSGRGERRLDAKAQAQPDDGRQVAGRWPPTDELARIVELHLLRPAEALP